MNGTDLFSSGEAADAVGLSRWKFLYHVVRLAEQCRQILTEGDLDLMCNAELLKSVRRGEWSIERVTQWFEDAEKELETLFRTTTAVPEYPDKNAIRSLLIRLLTMHFGSLAQDVVEPDRHTKALLEIKRIVESSGLQ